MLKVIMISWTLLVLFSHRKENKSYKNIFPIIRIPTRQTLMELKLSDEQHSLGIWKVSNRTWVLWLKGWWKETLKFCLDFLSLGLQPPLTHKHTLFNHSILLYSKSERKLFDSEMKVEELSNEHALRCGVKRKQNPKILQAAVACVSEFHPGFWGKSELQFSFNSIRHPFGRVNLFPFVSSLWLSWYKLLSLGH